MITIGSKIALNTATGFRTVCLKLRRSMIVESVLIVRSPSCSRGRAGPGSRQRGPGSLPRTPRRRLPGPDRPREHEGERTMSTDSTVMLRRNFKHTVRNPIAVFNAILLPIVIMLMFVGEIGGAFNVGVKYVDYATPGMIVLTICYGLSATALAVNSDMTKGIINRFKVMDISRSAVLSAQVLSTVLRTVVAVVAIIGVAFALGFRPHADVPDWLGAIGLIIVVSFATSWLTVALGLAAKTPESAGMASVPIVLLPFLSSAIVPADKMGPGVRQFAEYQPFTPIIETLRGLLTGEPSASKAIIAVAWCVGIGLVGYVWSLATFTKRA